MPAAASLPSLVLRDLLTRGTTVEEIADAFGHKGFAVGFAVLLAPTALPFPTGGATHVLEVIAVVLALQLIAGRRSPWLPRRLRSRTVGGDQRFAARLVGLLAWSERHTRPRLRRLFTHRAANAVFGGVVLLFTVAAFAAPPFTGLDTLPALGVVLVSLGVLFDDGLFVGGGLVAGTVGIALEIAVGAALVDVVT